MKRNPCRCLLRDLCLLTVPKTGFVSIIYSQQQSVQQEEDFRQMKFSAHKGKEGNMANLITIQYDDPYKADEVRLTLVRLQREYLIDLEDAVVAVKNKKGKVKLHQALNLKTSGAVQGGFWGTLIGLLFFSPLLGAAIGASVGTVSGALSDVGINDNFMKNLSECLQPNTSILFILVRQATPDRVLEEIKEYGGTVLQTSLSHEDEAKLQAALDETKAEAVV